MNNVKDCSRSSIDKEQKRCWLPVWQDGRIEQLSEKQELSGTLMESKKSLQKVAPEESL